tara:strand:- start:447 stop:599 length:153 start_codon:yes stop_codon:yes gene_type:complete
MFVAPRYLALEKGFDVDKIWQLRKLEEALINEVRLYKWFFRNGTAVRIKR